MMDSSVKQALEGFIANEKLPAAYLETAEQWFIPLTERVLQKVAHSHEPLIVGVSGCQGSGKSTLAALLVLLLKEMMGLRAINLSLDDFYHTSAHRQELARSVQPLLATRGVPGTHDVDLAITTLKQLRASGSAAVPRFDKSVDDRAAPDTWPVVATPVDVIVLEGWCLAIPEQPIAELATPVNSLEAEEDSQGIWRRFVNDAIASEYKTLYGMIDYLIMLKAPDFALVKQWRGRQEEKLATSIAAIEQAGSVAPANKVMSPAQLQRFIAHYERLTRHGLAVLPAISDEVFLLTEEQTIAGKL